jgi:pimeloyl-ACP methyl ester carboxylesterase
LSTFVFVSGGWHGGWCWKRVADRLRALGHEVYTPTLTGLGERAHLNSPSVDLETHIADVLGVLEWEDLHDVVLVGHSYGGMIITPVADRVPERLARLVYLDAVWPIDGETNAALIGEEGMRMIGGIEPDPEHPARIRHAAEFARVMGATGDDVEWIASKLTPHPQGTLTQPTRLSREDSGLPVLYIACMGGYRGDENVGLNLSLSRARARAAKSSEVRIVELDAPHNAMVTHPDELTELLLDPL